MLVLSRKVGESIKLGDDITISIEKIKGHAVRIGIEAPASVQIVRTELLTGQQPAAPSDTQGKDDAHVDVQ